MAGSSTGKTPSNKVKGTASPDDVARLAARAESWWDEDGPYKALHKLNPARVAFIKEHVSRHFGRDKSAERPFEGLTLLDIGCGGGLLSEPMRRLGADVTGIDAAGKNILVAQRHAERSGLDIGYRHVLPEALAGEGAGFDVVLNMEVVEHVPDLAAFLEACCALIEPGGAMAISTINRTLKAFALAKLGAEYALRWVPPGTHDWNRFVKPSELSAGLRPHGVGIVKLEGVVYRPLGGAWLPSRDMDVNYLAFSVKN